MKNATFYAAMRIKKGYTIYAESGGVRVQITNCDNKREANKIIAALVKLQKTEI
jgi:hypothetical protein